MPVDVALNTLARQQPQRYASTTKSFARQSSSPSDIGQSRGL
jgi:hypothetical protein